VAQADGWVVARGWNSSSSSSSSSRTLCTRGGGTSTGSTWTAPAAAEAGMKVLACALQVVVKGPVVAAVAAMAAGVVETEVP
jgi:hypothetical protein